MARRLLLPHPAGDMAELPVTIGMVDPSVFLRLDCRL